ncbi:MAG: hypothetical protein AB1644_07995 [Candidatus Zixiibacteriota bacterium]
MRRPLVLLTALTTWIGLLLTAVFLPRVHQGNAGESSVASHLNIDCSRCHAVVASVGDGNAAMPDFDTQCRSCHTNLVRIDQSNSLSFHQNSSRPCRECHSFHEPMGITVGDRQFLMRFEQRNRLSQCRACHGLDQQLASLSEGHQAAARLYHTDYRIVGALTPSQTCLVCHSEQSISTPELSAAMSKAPRFSEHGSHPVGVRVVPSGGRDGRRLLKQLDPRVQLFDNRMECQTCHSLSSPLPHHLAGFKDKDDLCRACHYFE